MGKKNKTTRKTPPPSKKDEKTECILEEVKHLEHEVVEHVEKAVERIEHDIEHLFHHHSRRTTSIAIYFGENTMNDVTLLVGQSTIGTITPLEADGVTVTPGAVVSAASFNIASPDSAFSAVDNGDGTITITALNPSAAAETGTATATVTDADGTVNQFTASFTVTVTATTPPPPPTGRTASIGVSFSTPA